MRHLKFYYLLGLIILANLPFRSESQEKPRQEKLTFSWNADSPFSHQLEKSDELKSDNSWNPINTLPRARTEDGLSRVDYLLDQKDKKSFFRLRKNATGELIQIQSIQLQNADQDFPLQNFSLDPLQLEMIYVPPGSFTMGAGENHLTQNWNESAREVFLTDGFWLGKYEVLQSQWMALMSSNPSLNSVGGSFPVENVIYSKAIEFCEKLTQDERGRGNIPNYLKFTLPTEAQWEYACRAGTETDYYYGNTFDPKKQNVLETLIGTTVEAGSYQPNTWGFFDMYGNVSEWCLEYYGAYSLKFEFDPTGPKHGTARVYRGGGWSYKGRTTRSADRFYNLPIYRSPTLGFRVALVWDESVIQVANPETANSFTVQELKIDMQYVVPGSFLMGSDPDEEGHHPEEIQHEVNITKPFWMSACEISQTQWNQLMPSNPSSYQTDPQFPVENISYAQALAFCDALTQREQNLGRIPLDWKFHLPSEAEWEYACRGGTQSAFGLGQSINGLSANVNGNFPYLEDPKSIYKVSPTPVGSYAPNNWGFYDMHGNVLEWCRDGKRNYNRNKATDPIGPNESFKVMRGGGWSNGVRNCRSAQRYTFHENWRSADLGFRVVLIKDE